MAIMIFELAMVKILNSQVLKGCSQEFCKVSRTCSQSRTEHEPTAPPSTIMLLPAHLLLTAVLLVVKSHAVP